MVGQSAWRSLVVGVAAVVLAMTAACGPTEAQTGSGVRRLASAVAGREVGTGGLYAFRSDDELREFLRRHRRSQRGRYGPYSEGMALPSPSAPPPSAAQSADAAAAPPSIQARASEAPNAQPGSITNNQEEGVDEGDIVKNRGDLLIVLRRGRLFTVDTARGNLEPVSVIDAFPPGTSGQGAWYDEMLVAGDRVVVIGYSYQRGGTEIVRFRLSPEGRLSFEDAYHLKGNDYYSSRNYASRLVGNQLVVYSPLNLNMGDEDPLSILPGVRRWNGDTNGPFERIVSAQQIYLPPSMREGDAPIEALHTLVSCDLLAPQLECTAEGVLGPSSRSFYVSQRAIYLWLTAGYPEGGRGTPAAFVYRLPLSGAPPAAAAVRGAPTDQFSFREDRSDDTLNVLVRSQSSGDAMLSSEFNSGAVALLRLPLREFGSAEREVPASRYRLLPKPDGSSGFQNRFVGDYILYGDEGSGYADRGRGSRLYVANIRGGEPVEFPLTSSIARIEPIGPDAVVVGDAARDLMFTPIELRGRPAIANPYVLPSATQGETRSHGFFFRPDGGGDGSDGILALPVAKPAPERLQALLGSSASILFLRRAGREFDPLGELDAHAAGAVDDNCVASCTDWYGNARPIFLGDRIYALLGYELVEGVVDRRGIREVRRLNFAPTSLRDGGPEESQGPDDGGDWMSGSGK